MTDSRDAFLEEVRAALKKATPGPWGTEKYEPQRVQQTASEVSIGYCGTGMVASSTGSYNINRPEAVANAALIAGAPVWLAQLCDRVEALRAERDALRAAGGNLYETLDDILSHDTACAARLAWKYQRPMEPCTCGLEQVLTAWARLTAPPSDPAETP